jgi:hypothetical protein
MLKIGNPPKLFSYYSPHGLIRNPPDPVVDPPAP